MAVDLGRRPHDRVRARLRHLDARHATGQAHQVPIALRGAPAAAGVEHRTLQRSAAGARALARRQEGRRSSCTVRSSRRREGRRRRRPRDPDRRRRRRDRAGRRTADDLSTCRDRDGTNHLFIYDFGTAQGNAAHDRRGRDDVPRYSPDGKSDRVRAQLEGAARSSIPRRKKRSCSRPARSIAPPFVDVRDFAWSPDSRFVAYLAAGTKTFQNVHVVAVAGGEARAGQLPGQRATPVRSSWSPGRHIPDVRHLAAHRAGRRGARRSAAAHAAVPRGSVPRSVPGRAAEARRRSRRPRRRLQRVPRRRRPCRHRARPDRAPGATSSSTTSGAERPSLPVGVDVARAGDQPRRQDGCCSPPAPPAQQNLYIFPLDELSKEPAVARQLTSTPGGKRERAVHRRQQGGLLPRSRPPLQRHAREARAAADRRRAPSSTSTSRARSSRCSTRRGHTCATTSSTTKINGVDWNAVRTTYEPRVAGARTPDEMRRIISLMLGELNASHMGISGAGAGRRSRRSGGSAVRLRSRRVRAARRAASRAVVPLGPAALAGIKPGDYIVAGRRRADRRAHEPRLRCSITRSATGHARGRRTPTARAARRRRRADRPGDREGAALSRIGSSSAARYVAKASGGRLGYVHMYDMSARRARAAVHRSRRRESRARQGVVVDIRNNNGGFVNVYAIDVLRAPRLSDMTRRGASDGAGALAARPARAELPTMLVTNQHSLSDAEDFTEGYRTLKLGKVVGRADRRMDHLHRRRHADRRIGAAHAGRRSSPNDGTPWRCTRAPSTSR